MTKAEAIQARVCDIKMKYKQNPLTGDWLCWIPDTTHAYYYSTKKSAEGFCKKVNNAFANGELSFNNVGELIYNKYPNLNK